jgi:recombination protein U
MKNQGKLFEEDFKASVPKNVYYLRLHDPATSFLSNQTDSDHKTMRFSLKNPYDAVLCKNGQMYCVELKTVGGASASFFGKTPVIKVRQVESLLSAKQKGGARAYLVIRFRRFQETYAIEPERFLAWMCQTNRKSLPISTARSIGIRLPEKKRRTRFRFDLSPLFEME